MTLGQIRRDEPSWFEPESFIKDQSLWAANITATLAMEYVLARKAFAKASGQPDPHPERNREEMMHLIDDAYRRYRLSSGRKATRELVRTFEAAATTQALGRSQ
ncbi:MAG: hypothetical protein IT459_05640 [Planctomycetes bacterium]|nr:hypothetical protein [Planctomycetota bacterium]